MYTSIRYFTLEDAEETLLAIIPMLSKIQKEKQKVDVKFKEWEKAEQENKTTEAAILRAQIEFTAQNIEEMIDHIQDKGCLLKDIETGLVDFPARIAGREIYLCWKFGEPRIQFWHGISEGFPGRKPL